MQKLSKLYKQIVSTQNLWDAAWQTLLHGRRFKNVGASFKLTYEHSLLQIHKELATQTYKHGKYKEFIIYEPKHRKVLAAPIKDRIVHHALHDVIEPFIDRKFIFDSYACRKNKGTHLAINRSQKMMQSNQFFMHLDVKKYFQNINHQILKTILSKHIKQADVLNLFHIIINSSVKKEEPTTAPNLFTTPIKGLPIGNLTSQFLANLYLNELDQYVKHHLKIKHYVRYMDDFVVFGNNRKQMLQWQQQIVGFCTQKLALSLHIKGGIKNYWEGLGFLGFKIFRKHKKLKSVCLNRYLQKYKQQSKQVAKGKISAEKLEQSITTWQNHISFADTYKLQEYLIPKYNLNIQPSKKELAI